MGSTSNARQSSAVHVGQFVSAKLSGYHETNNYSSWKIQMLCLIGSQDLLRFIDANIPHPIPSPPGIAIGEDYERHIYLELYRAAIMGNWDAASLILQQNGGAISARISSTLETTLHIAVGTRKSIKFVTKLVGLMSEDMLELQDVRGYNPLHIAAMTGNTKAARILVERNPRLLNVPSRNGRYPVHMAAVGHKDTLEYLILAAVEYKDTLQYLISETERTNTNPYFGETGVMLLNTVIDADFFDVALKLATDHNHVHMSTLKLADGNSALKRIALKDTAFNSGRRFTFWESFLHSQIHKRETFLTLNASLCKVLEKLVPCFVEIRRKQVVHGQALELVKCLCEKMENLSFPEASAIYSDAILTAARLGIHEVIEAVVSTFPAAIYSHDLRTRQFMFHVAVRNRSEKVFNLIYQMSDHKHQYSDLTDSSGDTLLHLAARLAPPHKLSLVSGAALQMQRELQWFREVEKVVHPYSRERTNNAGKTPKMVFIEEHVKLKVEGEKWMKDTANSCTITAALIATVVFASAITVPGGTESSTGFPFFFQKHSFTIFALSDSASLFTSVTSILMFLSILTSRYAVEDFLSALPKRLIFGLISLFLSISFMIAAFGAALYLVFGRMGAICLIGIAAFASLPITSFVMLQFPLFVDLISSTYGHGIFRKQTNKPFY
ncbi:hypothetical protein ACJIZ3_023481 [Penstemon smallii]|uniref:PGG domain-containing protein n=1 Tax=Penstemon smallii TaxID=265156 RepID=A0ABD3TQ85_9LAMI